MKKSEDTKKVEAKLPETKTVRTRARRVRKFDFKFSRRAIVPLLVGIILGGGLIIFGVVMQNRSTFADVEIRDEEAVKSDIDEAYKKVEDLRKKRNEIEVQDSEAYRAAQNELAKAEAERADLEEELLHTKSGLYRNLRVEATFDGVPFVTIGVVIAILGVGVSYQMLRKEKLESLKKAEK